MKKLRSIILRQLALMFCVLAISACSPGQGPMIAMPQEGVVIESRYAKNDTIKAGVGQVEVLASGRWKSVYSYYIDLEIKNNSGKTISVAPEKIGVKGTDVVAVGDNKKYVENVSQLKVFERDGFLYTSDPAPGDKIEAMMIAPGNSAKIELSYSLKMSKEGRLVRSGDEVELKIPAAELGGTGDDKDIVFKFTCKLPSEVEFIEKEPKRGTPH